MDVTVIADASWDPHTKVGGYGFWIKCERGAMPGQGGFKQDIESPATAEAMAIVNALAMGVLNNLIQTNDKVLFQTDCMAAIQLFEGSRVVDKRTQDYKAKEKLYDLVRQIQIKAVFRHVKGHTLRTEARYITNRLCDQRAKTEMRKLREKRVAQNHIRQIEELLA